MEVVSTVFRVKCDSFVRTRQGTSKAPPFTLRLERYLISYLLSTPAAKGSINLPPSSLHRGLRQRDRDGLLLSGLPPSLVVVLTHSAHAFECDLSCGAVREEDGQQRRLCRRTLQR